MRAKAIPTILSALLLLLAFGTSTAQAAVDSKGTDFFFSFQHNFRSNGNISLFITAEQDTQGLVEIAGLNFNQAFTVQANQVTTVALPRDAMRLPNNVVSRLGVKVTAESEITVYGLNQQRATTDAFLALPVDALGLEYRLVSFPGPNVFDHIPSHFAVTGVFDGTQVTIVPSDTGVGRARGVPFTITLNSGETYFLQGPFIGGGRFNPSDFTGTRITATAPVAVTSGAECSFVPRNFRACDHLVEMLPPVAAWGESFLTVPLATRLRGDLFRIVASQNSTEIRIDGTPRATLNAGQFFEAILTTPSQIEASAPVLLAQFSTGTNFDGVTSDPFMMLVPPTEQFLQQYTFSTPATVFNINFVNVVVPTPEVESLTLDGLPVDSTLFAPIGNSGFSGAKIPVARGSHTLIGNAPFGIYSYGFAAADSYGYPGGMAFDFINPAGDAFAPNVRLTPLDDTIFGTATDSEDINANGVLDAGEDLNGNGMIGRRTEDLNGNGVLDAGEDANNNGILDRDTGIFRVELDPGATNLQLDVPAFVPGALRVDFTITLIDRNQPGEGVLRIVDGTGNTIEAPINLSLVPTLRQVRVIDTLSTDNIELDSASFSRPPHSITMVDGQTVIEWRFDRISVDQIEDIDFDVTLRNPIPGEERVVSHKLELIYNDVNGNEVRTELGAQSVKVLASVFQLGVNTDRSSYTANEQVIITTDLTNRGAFAANATVQLSIKDAAGALVADLGVLPTVSLGAGASRQFTGTDFFTGTTLEGQYEVHAELLDALGKPFERAVAPFAVVTPTADKQEISVTTDKQVYAPLETIQILNRVSNKTPNAILDGLTTTTTVFDPGNAVLFTETAVLPQLLPNSLRDLNLEFPLGRVPPGIYRIIVVVNDAQGVELARAETTITVQSTADTGSGLRGSLSVTPNPVLKTEFLSLAASVENLGNSDVPNLPVTLSIIDPANEQVVIEWTDTVENLVQDGQHFIERQWQALAPIGSTFIAVLRANIGGEDKLLAQEVFAVREKIESDFTLGPRGRLLVLLDEVKQHGGDSARDPHGPKNAPNLLEQRQFLDSLLQREGWSFTVVTDKKAFARELRSGAYAVYALFAEDVKLDEQVQKELREAVFRGEGLLVAGDHDRRNREIEQALGIKVPGKHAEAAGLELLVSALHPGGSVNLALQDKPRRAIPKGAAVVGRFVGLKAGNRDDDDDSDEDDDKHGHKGKNEDSDDSRDSDGHGRDDDDEDEDDDDDVFDDLFSDVAVTVHEFGTGRSVFGGIDLLAEATLAGEDRLFATLLVNALAHVHPDPLAVRAGGVAPLRLTLTNRGTPTPGQALIVLPDGIEIVDAGRATPNSPLSLVWPFELATDETATLDIWLRLPDALDPVSFSALIQVGPAAELLDHNTIDFSITPEANPAIADVMAQIDAVVDPDKALRKVRESLEEAEEELSEGDVEDALEELVEATDKLIKSTHPEASNVRQQIDRLIWVIGQRFKAEHDD